MDMDALVKVLDQRYPDITFIAGEVAHWSPANSQVVYVNEANETEVWTLFHELSHALLQHASYQNDVDLLQKEVAAWEQALGIALEYGVTISDQHIQTCLDSYRDWLHKRSTCPVCARHGVQSSLNAYNCLNCNTVWKVSSDRFCRPYRLKKA